MEADIRKKIYLKLFYSIIDWEWFHEPNTLVVFIHLLVHANRKPQRYSGDVIKRGEVLASLDFLAKDTGLSVRNIRTAIGHLKTTGEVTSRKIGNTTVYSIVNYDKYQYTDKTTDNCLTTDRQLPDNEVTTLRECKNDIMRDCKSVCEGESTHAFGRYRNVILSETEHQAFMKKHSLRGEAIIDELSAKLLLDGKKYKGSHAVWLDIFAKNYTPPKKTKPEDDYTPPNYDANSVIQRSLNLDPTKTKKGQ